MRLSVLKAAFPEQLDRTDLRSSYIVIRDIGPFGAIQYYFLTDETEPEIRSIGYHFTEGDLKRVEQLVKQAAIKAFGEKGLESRRLGASLVWKDVGGVEVEVDESTYSVRRRLNEYQ